MLFEIFFERLSDKPGAVGSWDKEAPPPTVAKRWVLVLRALLGLVVFAGLAAIVIEADLPWLAAAAALLYLVVAYYVRVEPDMRNTGMLGFLDHPFRWSDDQNRILVFFRVVLAPGRFAVASARDLIRHLRGERVIYLRRE